MKKLRDYYHVICILAGLAVAILYVVCLFDAGYCENCHTWAWSWHPFWR